MITTDCVDGFSFREEVNSGRYFLFNQMVKNNFLHQISRYSQQIDATFVLTSIYFVHKHT